MDLLQKVFEKYWRFRKKNKMSPHGADLSELRDYLGTISSFIWPEAGRLEINAGLYFAGVWGRALILPEKIDIFPTFELNRLAYLSLTLRSCMAAKMRLWGDSTIQSRNGQRVEFLNVSSQINLRLDESFPNLKDVDVTLSAAAGPILPNRIFEEWLRHLNLRGGSRVSPFIMAQKYSIKSGDQLNPVVQALIPCLPQRQAGDFSGLYPDANDLGKSAESPASSQKENKRSEAVRKVDLEQENQNPVIHSFEKMETADDYSGGRRTEDGEDELENHSAALEEVEISQVTLSGAHTRSIYKTDRSALLSRQSQEPGGPVFEKRRYPEWSESIRAYLPNYCSLTAHGPEVGGSELQLDLTFRNEVQRRYAKNLAVWRGKISQIFNEPLWLKRQRDGSEIDLDAVVRLLSDRGHREVHAESPRLYAEKRVREQSIAVHILFDQSLSTDSWIEQRRVIDLILESVGVCGILFEGLLPDIQVAGAWSATRHNCHVEIYKRPNEPWERYFARAMKIVPQGYTRLGASIRYCVEQLSNLSTRRKVLLLLTDAKPTDLDLYEGHHGIHDVKKACSEAEEVGVQTIAIAVDQRHRSHFSVMFKNPIILTQVSSLPDLLVRELLRIVHG